MNMVQSEHIKQRQISKRWSLAMMAFFALAVAFVAPVLQAQDTTITFLDDDPRRGVTIGIIEEYDETTFTFLDDDWDGDQMVFNYTDETEFVQLSLEEAVGIPALVQYTFDANWEYNAVSVIAMPRDWSDQPRVVHGRLVSVDDDDITITGTHGLFGKKESTYSYNSATIVEGCTLDEVEAGVFVSIVPEKEDGEETDVAKRIMFKGCFNVQGMEAMAGKVTEVTADGFTLESSTQVTIKFFGFTWKLEGRTQETTAFTINDDSKLTDCRGKDLAFADLEVGDILNVSYRANKDNLVVRANSQDGCPQSFHGEGTFVSKTDETITLKMVDGQELTFHVGDEFFFLLTGKLFPEFDSLGLFVFNCAGRIEPWENIKVGDVIQISYNNYDEEKLTVEFMRIERGCPVYFEGEITAINGDEITFKDNQGNTIVGIVTDMTSIGSLTGLGSDVLEVGDPVNASYVEGEDGTKTMQWIQVRERFTFNFVEGEVSDVSADGFTVKGYGRNDNEIVINFSDTMYVMNCFGLELDRSAIKVGDVVHVEYMADVQGRAFAQGVFIENCPEKVSDFGVVTAVDAASITYTSNDSEEDVVITIDADETFFVNNCTGDEVSLADVTVGAKIATEYIKGDNENTATFVSLFDDCPVWKIDGGVVTAVSDEAIVVTTKDGAVNRYDRIEETLVIDETLMLVAWDDMQVGNDVCVDYIEQGNERTAVLVRYGFTCSKGGIFVPTQDGNKGFETQSIGKLQKKGNQEITIAYNGGEVSYRVGATTKINGVGNQAITIDQLQEGMYLHVVSGARTQSNKPVASVINVQGTPTSVDENPVATENAAMVFPNPAGEEATVRFTLPQAGVVTVTLMDQIGREVMTVVSSQKFEAGTVSVPFSTTGLQNGVYFFRVSGAGTTQTGQVTVSK